MSNPEHPPGQTPDSGSDPWRPTPGGTYGSASVPQQPGPPSEPQSPPPPTAPTAPFQTGYPSSLEPPGPVVPSQPGSYHDQPTSMSYMPGSASVSPPGVPPPGPTMPDFAPPGQPGQTSLQPGPGPWQPEPALGMPPGPGMPPPPRRGGKGSLIGLIIVSVVAVLLLGAGGILAYLWTDTSDQLDQSQGQVASLESTITEQADQMEGIQSELDEAREQIETLQTDLAGSEGEVEYLQEAQAAIDSCLSLIEQWLALIALDDIDAARDLEDEVNDTCDEADQYR